MLGDPVEKYLPEFKGQRGRILVWMVQHNGFPGNGGRSQDAFRQAAAAFAP